MNTFQTIRCSEMCIQTIYLSENELQHSSFIHVPIIWWMTQNIVNNYLGLSDAVLKYVWISWQILPAVENTAKYFYYHRELFTLPT